MNVNETLNSKTVAELRKLAACYDITGRSTMKKAELIDKLIDSGVELRLSIDAAYIEDGLKADADAGTYSLVNEVAILRDAPGRAIVTAAFDGRTVGGSIVRRGNRLVLMSSSGTIIGTSFEKVAKRFAARLGFRAEIIDVAKAF